MNYIHEPERNIPVCDDCDLFVAGGSCTGVFAAVRAARLGLRVILTERTNCLGGTATGGLVNVWHSLKDTDYKNQVIAGLTQEMTERLVKSGSAELSDSPSTAIVFDPNRLKYELDRLASEEKIKVYFHTLSVGVICDENKITAALIENKDGRGAVTSRFFIDATGDGDIMKYLKLPMYYGNPMQPPTACFLMQGSTDNVDFMKILREHGSEVGMPKDTGWSGAVPDVSDVYLRADFHVFDTDCASAYDLSLAEAEGRRKAYAFTELLKKYSTIKPSIVAFCSQLGVRETRHFETKTKANGHDMLVGKRYDSAILNGTYRSDTHNTDGGLTFRYLNGDIMQRDGNGNETHGNWRNDEGLSGEAAKFYQIPFEVLVQEKYENLIAAGRMINADVIAYGALRVMVNLNQVGEAAGIAAYLSLQNNLPVYKLSGRDVRQELIKGGSAL